MDILANVSGNFQKISHLDIFLDSGFYIGLKLDFSEKVPKLIFFDFFVKIVFLLYPFHQLSIAMQLDIRRYNILT